MRTLSRPPLQKQATSTQGLHDMETPNRLLLEKYGRLTEYLKSLESVVVAFSGGVDSTFLLHAAKEALGERCVAVTASSYLFPEREFKEARDFCSERGIQELVVKVEELKIEGFSQNPKDRCYLCKKDLFERIRRLADERGIKEIVEGSNIDDNGDYRPGHLAVAELNIKSPFREIGFSKEQIRILSSYFGLPTWNKPSFACLASRIPYGDEITEEKLQMVDRAEQLLLDLGFKQLRVRVHGKIARIELLPSDFERFMEEKIRTKVHEELHKTGFDYVTLDILGYRTGSMNETLSEKEKHAFPAGHVQ